MQEEEAAKQERLTELRQQEQREKAEARAELERFVWIYYFRIFFILFYPYPLYVDSFLFTLLVSIRYYHSHAKKYLF